VAAPGESPVYDTQDSTLILLNDLQSESISRRYEFEDHFRLGIQLAKFYVASGFVPTFRHAAESHYKAAMQKAKRKPLEKARIHIFASHLKISDPAATEQDLIAAYSALDEARQLALRKTPRAKQRALRDQLLVNVAALMQYLESRGIKPEQARQESSESVGQVATGGVVEIVTEAPLMTDKTTIDYGY